MPLALAPLVQQKLEVICKILSTLFSCLIDSGSELLLGCKICVLCLLRLRFVTVDRQTSASHKRAHKQWQIVCDNRLDIVAGQMCPCGLPADGRTQLPRVVASDIDGAIPPAAREHLRFFFPPIKLN